MSRILLIAILAFVPSTAMACGQDCQRQMQEQIREANQRQIEETNRRNEQIRQEERLRNDFENSFKK
jgi:hypothetical protein